GHTEQVAAVGDLHPQAQLDLAQVLVEGPAQVGQPLDLFRLQHEVALRALATHAACTCSAACTRPRSELAMTSVTSTSTKRPTRRASPGKFTERMFSVLPVSSRGSRRAGPSTSTRCTLPSMPCEMARALPSITACRRCRRCFFSASGVASSRLEAGVPGRAE